jgi:hypothetical protein
MSSTGPIPQSGAGFWTQHVNVLRQQQEEVIKRLTLAQQQAAKLAAMKTPPSPGLTPEALQANVNDQLNTMRTTVQQTYQTVGEALAQGNATVATGALETLQATLTNSVQELKAQQSRVEALLKWLEQKMQADRVSPQQTLQGLREGTELFIRMVNETSQARDTILKNTSL